MNAFPLSFVYLYVVERAVPVITSIRGKQLIQLTVELLPYLKISDLVIFDPPYYNITAGHLPRIGEPKPDPASCLRL